MKKICDSLKNFITRNERDVTECNYGIYLLMHPELYMKYQNITIEILNIKKLLDLRIFVFVVIKPPVKINVSSRFFKNLSQISIYPGVLVTKITGFALNMKKFYNST